MPRAHFAEMRASPGEHDFIVCVFELDPDERALAERHGADPNTTATLEVIRDFDGRYLFRFPDAPGFNLLGALARPGVVTANEEGEADAVAATTKGPDLFDELQRRLPAFVYYSNYGNLDAQIYLPQVVENLKRTDLGQKEAAKARTLKVLFKLVGLSPEEVLELGRATGVTQTRDYYGNVTTSDAKTEAEIVRDDEQLRERQALLQSASAKLTRSFKEWWKQGDYRFRLVADGNYFRIFVSDARRPEEIELENRSAGLQWFLSFFLVFTYESEASHENAVVLLDEPGHSLHPLAQRDLSAFFDGLASTNQLLFTTHSPFLIDGDRLDRVRKVFVAADGGTAASSDLGQARRQGGERDAGATYAVHSALNLTVAESLLLGCTPVIVEGPSDQHYLSGIKNALIGQGRIAPKAELVFPPSGGARTAKLIAAILMGRDDVLPFVLLDGDQAGQQAARALREDLYAGFTDRVITTDEVLAGKMGTEVEDLMPPELIVEVLDRMERRAGRPFEDAHDPAQPIVPQIRAWAQAEGFDLAQDWKVRLSLGVKERLRTRLGRYADDAVLDCWTTLLSRFC
ncbi:OLD family endonuclease [Rubellimicrobium rubrum]|uniref:OLD family endonuclease n=2 Tax=Rubellimicrobium rubrum TaxID=2585369 RepID=A0A5C4MZN5_9RHOB|nr:OLD family endonuclease [Rubellimicrobium rubrum]